MRLLALVFATFWIASPAYANRWSDADLQRAITVADARWPDSPCFGHHDIVWQPFAQLQTTINAIWPDYVQPGMVGFGSLEGCHVWIAWDKVPAGPAWLCTLLEHEFGHNAGMLHSTDRRDVMYPTLVRVADDCAAVFSTPRWHIYPSPGKRLGFLLR